MSSQPTKVLVVDDERSVRQLVANVLRQEGYRVYEAADGKAAIEIVRDTGTDIDLLLADVVLPGMNGAELAEVLHATNPDMRTIFMSGYQEDELAERGIGRVGGAYITKPFTAEVLTLVVEGALGQ